MPTTAQSCVVSSCRVVALPRYWFETPNRECRARLGGQRPVKVTANHKLCSGHARCAAVASEFFPLNDDGYVGFEEKAVPAEFEAVARRGVRACPERALTLVESDR